MNKEQQNQNALVVFEDLVDDAVTATPCRPETLEFANQRLAEPVWGVAIGLKTDSSAACRTFSRSLLR